MSPLHQYSALLENSDFNDAMTWVNSFKSISHWHTLSADLSSPNESTQESKKMTRDRLELEAQMKERTIYKAGYDNLGRTKPDPEELYKLKDEPVKTTMETGILILSLLNQYLLMQEIILQLHTNIRTTNKSSFQFLKMVKSRLLCNQFRDHAFFDDSWIQQFRLCNLSFLQHHRFPHIQERKKLFRSFVTNANEYYNLPPRTVSPVLVAIVASRAVDPVGSPSSTTIDQDEQSTSTSPTNQEIQSQVTHQDSAHPFESPLAGKTDITFTRRRVPSNWLMKMKFNRLLNLIWMIMSTIYNKDETTGPSVHPEDATSTKMVRETLSHADAESGGNSEKINSETDTEILNVGSNSKQSHVALAGPNPEHMQDVFLATNYPKIATRFSFEGKMSSYRQLFPSKGNYLLGHGLLNIHATWD
ncbi:hypothetical protein Tco_0617193 [Tanacetum coccineum]